MKLAIFFVLAFFITPALAKEMPVLTRVPGQPIKATWSNGNEAELKFGRSPEKKVSIDYQVTENLCSPQNGDIFKVITPYRIDLLGWFWTKHSDPAKVGKVLMHHFFGDPNIKTRLTTFSFVTNGYQFQHPELLLGLPKDEIHFGSLKWLPGFENGTLKPFTVGTWMSEFMTTNSQTGLSENRIGSGAYGVHIKPTSDLTAEIDSIDSGFFLPLNGSSLIFVGDVVSWGWQNANGPCQIAFKPNLRPAITEVLIYLASLPEPATTYLWQQDSLPDTVEPQFMTEHLTNVIQ